MNDLNKAPPEAESLDEDVAEAVDLGDVLEKTQGSAFGNAFDGIGRWG